MYFMSNVTTRNFSLDLLRVVACYMVIQVHAGEFFYIGANGTVINDINSFWVAIYNSLFRAAVPLFVMITGYFLLPLNMEMKPFFKKRFSRVLIPFVIWCALYAVYFFCMGQSDLRTTLTNITHIVINYGVEVGHLWYVYMLIGIYLFIPVISPFLKTASKKVLEFYLIMWAVTLLLPYLHTIYPTIWGECFWNNTPMLYYFSGFLGYAVLGYYVKEYLNKSCSANRIAGGILVVVGLAITFIGFINRLDSVPSIAELELTWNYGTINVAMMGLGLMLLFKGITTKNKVVAKIITDISQMSYGIYLVHIMLLNFVYAQVVQLSTNAAAVLPVIAVLTFVLSYLVIKLISFIPKSKYIIG